MDHIKFYTKIHLEGLAGLAGLEPTKCQNQNLVPYHLATAQQKLAGMAGLEPTKCRNQNPVPYQLGDIPILR